MKKQKIASNGERITAGFFSILIMCFTVYFMVLGFDFPSTTWGFFKLIILTIAIICSFLISSELAMFALIGRKI